MADKDYGSVLTRYLDPAETGFDTVVYQAGNPLLDSEFVLDQEIQNRGRSALVRQTTPSGWLTGDFNKDGNEDFDFRSEADTFYLTNKPIVNVNGWIIPLEYASTSVAGENKIELDAPPSGIGNVAADFVYLEVWRSLVAPDPDDTNKPAGDKIYRHGNVQSLAAEWLDDDLIDPDPEINTESTKRVQIQYRLATTRLNSSDNRVGYSDAAVYAQGPNAALTTEQYQEVAGDSGLWRAGDGDHTNSLNTVDGYIYSIPVCIVFRRNSSGFTYTGNGNGGVLLASGTSDRPDGLYADEIVLDDVLDLRRNVSLNGFDWDRVLERNTSMLMDQTLQSWAMNTAHTGWMVAGEHDTGRSLLMADTLNHAGGVDSTGNAFRNTDGRCRIFSDRAHGEQYVEAYTKGANWSSGDTLTLDFAADVPANTPAGTVITDVVAVVQDEGQVDVPLTKVEGLGTANVTVTIGNPSVVSSRDIWVTYEIMYPAGSGLNAHVKAGATNFDVTVHDPTAFDLLVGTSFTNDDTGRAAIRDYVWAEFEQGPHREVGVYYTTSSEESVTVVSKDDTTVVLPERLFDGATGTTKGVVSVTDSGSTTYTVDSTTAGRTVKLSAPLPSANTEVTVDYYPKRAIPSGVGGITLYYMTPSIQAVTFDPYLQNAAPDNRLEISPVRVSPYMYVGTVGSGSYITPFPYEAPMNQIPVHIDLASVGSGPVFRGEHELSAPGDISIDDFDANTGFLRLPTMIPMAPVDHFTLTDPNGGVENNEFVSHYTGVDLTEYRPSAIAQGLSSVVEHKCFLPVVAQLEADTQFARKGEHVLVVFSNYLELSEDNRVGFADTDNTTCAAIYRLKGSLLTY
jgi:hypothetical protein